MDKTNINVLVQSIERSLHLIYKNIFSIKQYQFPPKKLARICLKNHAVLRHCFFADGCGYTFLPWTARSHSGARQGGEGVPPSVQPTRTKLDYDHGNTYYSMYLSNVFLGSCWSNEYCVGFSVTSCHGRGKNGSR